MRVTTSAAVVVVNNEPVDTGQRLATRPRVRPVLSLWVHAHANATRSLAKKSTVNECTPTKPPSLPV